MWTNIDELNIEAGALIFCEGITHRVDYVKSIKGRVITFVDGTRCGMGTSIKIYVAKTKAMADDILKLRDMFISEDMSNYNLALEIFMSITNE